MSNSKFIRIAFDEDFDFHYDLVEFRKYHQDSLKVCDLVEELGEETVREQVENSELVHPKLPKVTLKKLIIDIPEPNKSYDKLDSYLKNCYCRSLKQVILNFLTKSIVHQCFLF